MNFNNETGIESKTLYINKSRLSLVSKRNEKEKEKFNDIKVRLLSNYFIKKKQQQKFSLLIFE